MTDDRIAEIREWRQYVYEWGSMGKAEATAIDDLLAEVERQQRLADNYRELHETSEKAADRLREQVTQLEKMIPHPPKWCGDTNPHVVHVWYDRESRRERRCAAVVVGGEATPTETPACQHDWFEAVTEQGHHVHSCAVCNEQHHPWGRYGKSCDGCDVLPGPPAAVPVPAETPETKLLRDIFTDPAQRNNVWHEGQRVTVTNHEGHVEGAGKITSIGDNRVYIEGPRVPGDSRSLHWAVSLLAAKDLLTPLDDSPGGHRIDDEGDQNR